MEILTASLAWDATCRPAAAARWECCRACALHARSAPSSRRPGCSSITLTVTLPLSEEDGAEAASGTEGEERERSSCKMDEVTCKEGWTVAIRDGLMVARWES